MSVVYNILYNCCTCIFNVLWVIHIMWTVIIFLQNWEIISKPWIAKYPVGRKEHAATMVSGCVQDIMITIGGRGEGDNIVNDCWVMNISQKKHMYRKVLFIYFWSPDVHVTSIIIILNLYRLCFFIGFLMSTQAWDHCIKCENIIMTTDLFGV